jgi:hypothetical protein
MSVRLVKLLPPWNAEKFRMMQNEMPISLVKSRESGTSPYSARANIDVIFIWEPEPLPKGDVMIAVVMFGAIGFSILYLLLGGGFGGAVLIFIIAKMLGR